MDRRLPPSARIEADIEALLLAGTDQPERLSELGRLGAQLILQRAVEDEVTAFLGRARYERTPDANGSRNGSRPRRVQTAEGEIVIAMPQVRGGPERFVSSVIPDTRAVVRTRPLEALVIGAYVRGLSDRDIESLAAVFLRGFREAIGVATWLAIPYLLLNFVVVGRGAWEGVRDDPHANGPCGRRHQRHGPGVHATRG